jgi:hypothetical protein
LDLLFTGGLKSVFSLKRILVYLEYGGARIIPKGVKKDDLAGIPGEKD